MPALVTVLVVMAYESPIVLTGTVSTISNGIACPMAKAALVTSGVAPTGVDPSVGPRLTRMLTAPPVAVTRISVPRIRTWAACAGGAVGSDAMLGVLPVWTCITSCTVSATARTTALLNPVTLSPITG